MEARRALWEGLYEISFTICPTRLREKRTKLQGMLPELIGRIHKIAVSCLFTAL